MLLQSQIATVIDSQQKTFIKKERGLEREALNQLPIVENFALTQLAANPTKNVAVQ